MTDPLAQQIMAAGFAMLMCGLGVASLVWAIKWRN